MMVGAWVLPRVIVGITDASATNRFRRPCTALSSSVAAGAVGGHQSFACERWLDSSP
jgi:hypothetical protein